MNVVHLFAGVGGGLYADLILGHNPVCAVEIDPYCCAVLRQRSSEGWFPSLHVHEGDVREVDFASWAGRVDCIAAGFPCQDISCAGQGAGIEGKRSGLVSEVWRAIDVIRPSWVFLENSPVIRKRGRVSITRELVERGYRWRDGTLAASNVGSPGYERNRWWLLAHASELRCNRWSGQSRQARGGESQINPSDSHDQRKLQPQGSVNQGRRWDCNGAEQAPLSHSLGAVGLKIASSWNNGNGERSFREEAPSFTEVQAEDSAILLFQRLEVAVQQGWIRPADEEAIQAVARYCETYDWDPINSDLLRMVSGLPHKGHRIKALGNAQVPLQAAAAWVMLGGPVES
jgi:DNA (cytosine-5)-methyltransferase 1